MSHVWGWGVGTYISSDGLQVSLAGGVRYLVQCIMGNWVMVK